MGNHSSQPEPSAQPSVVQEKVVPLELCGAYVVLAEYYMDLPKDQGQTLDPVTLKIHGASAPEEKPLKGKNDQRQ